MTPPPAPDRRLLWLGEPFFSQAMRELGWSVDFHRIDRPVPLFWEDVLALGHGTPDVLVLGDGSLPPVLLGVERFPCLTAFVCVDSHIHSWHPLYARGFDLCCVSLKDHLPLFTRHMDSSRLLWSPPYAADSMRPPAGPPPAPAWDVLFAGKVDERTTPGRHALLRDLGRRLPGLVVRQGSFPELFAQARIVLNTAEGGDLNFRVFEALGCGACLVTPRLGHGQEELFCDGQDLFVYDQDDLDSLVSLLHGLLADPARRRRAADSGMARVNAGHRPRHRAQALHGLLTDAVTRGYPAARLARGGEPAVRLVYLHWAEAVGDPALARAFLRAAQGAAQGPAPSP